MQHSEAKQWTLVGVIGGNRVTPEVAELAYQVGFEIGRRGYSLVCGGRGGVMEAACKGLQEARREHGTRCVSIGILPGSDTSEANPYVDIALPTGMGIGRNILVVRAARAIVVVDGSSGTLSELAYAWQLGKPIVAVRSSGGVAERYAESALDYRRDEPILAAETPDEAVRMAVKSAGLPD